MRILAGGILAFLAMTGGAGAQSLLGPGDRSITDPPKRTSFKKHDHVQILVVERSRALSATDLKTDQRSRWETALDQWVRFNRVSGGITPRLNAADLTGNPGIDLDARFRQDNTGRTTRQFDLTFSITAEVIEIRPNGVLVLQAMKRRKINSDEEVIKLTGEITASAVANGAVRSDSIANLNITYDGSGAVSDTAKPGWLAWLLAKLWPF